jgi:diguanylate cyclase (GGDEF)-like protein/hemerythrin-like metal-binding protein
VVLTMSALAVIVLMLAIRLDSADAADRYTLMGIGLTLVLTIAASIVFLVRLGTLRVILRRLDGLMERHFRNMRKRRPIPQGDECMQISFALQLLEESMEAREKSERRLRQQERFSSSVLKVLHQSVIVSDGRGKVSLFSQGAEKMLGYSADEIIGKQSPMLFHDPEEVKKRAEELTADLGIPVTPAFPALVVKAWITGQVDEREWIYIRKDGSRITVLLSVTVFGDDQDNILCCAVATDITERSQVAAEMSRLANYDPLTQLPNRRLFHDRIRMAISQARREHNHLGLLMVDLDRFKPINDQYGHSVGDILLGEVAKRMLKCLRESDTLARMGGDEFVVILPMIGDVKDAVGVATKIRQSLCLPFELTDGITVNIDCCIGVALYPNHGNDEDSLLKSADGAMYVAKELGRAQICVAGGARRRDWIVNPREGRPAGPLTWRREYECGEEIIDQQHKLLFEHVNAIVRAVGSVSPEHIPEMLEQLIGEVSTHFQDEESILASRGYAGLEAHVQKHRVLTERAQELYRLAAARELPIGEALSFVTRDVVARHMLTDDREFFPILQRDTRHLRP